MGYSPKDHKESDKTKHTTTFHDFLVSHDPVGASLVAQMVKNPIYSAGDLDSIPGLGRSPGEGSGSPLQYSCLENPMDRGA